MNLVLPTIIFICCPLYTFEESLTNRLLELGTSLTKRLKDPTKQGAELLADLQGFLGELFGVYEKVITRDGQLIKEGIAEFDGLNSSGNPLHFKMDVDFHLLKEKYYWGYDDRVLHAKDLLNETEILWNKVAERINYVRF